MPADAFIPDWPRVPDFMPETASATLTNEGASACGPQEGVSDLQSSAPAQRGATRSAPATARSRNCVGVIRFDSNIVDVSCVGAASDPGGRLVSAARCLGFSRSVKEKRTGAVS